MKVTKLSIISILFTLMVGCDSMEKDWDRAESLPTMDAYYAYNEFLAKYPESDLAQQAKLRIEEIEFGLAQKFDRVADYEDFLTRYPTGPYATKARDAIEAKHFSNARRDNSIESYTGFLDLYSSGDNADSARQAIETINFEQVKVQNTIAAYETYLERYPDGTYFFEANNWLESATPSFSTGGPQNTKHVSIAVNQSYGAAKDISFPFLEWTRTVLESANFRVGSEGIGAEQGQLIIQVKGTPLSKNYPPTLYTGARVQGRFSFVVQGKDIYGSNFNYEKTPPESEIMPSWQYEEYKQPGGAPFGVFDFWNELGDMIVELWGIEILLDSLKNSKDWGIKNDLLHYLSQTKDPNILERLLEDLEVLESPPVPKMSDEMAKRTRMGEADRSASPQFAGVLAGFGQAGCDILTKELVEETNTLKLRTSAAVALGEIECQDAVEPLIGVLGGDNDSLRRYSSIALHEITGESFGKDQAKWLEWWNKEKRRSALPR